VPLNFYFPVDSVLATLVVTMAVAILAAWGPSWRAAHMSIAETLRYG
jgi:ABC-type lipoprotein release transport system permease subunit